MAAKKHLTLLSWNVNGIRAAHKKGFLRYLEDCGADIVSVQETKAHLEQLPDDLVHPFGFESYWNQAKKKGYSGVATYTRVSPILANSSFREDLLDEEGRVVMLEFSDFFLFNVYFPNGARNPERLDYKLKFYKRFLKLMEEFRKKKPIVLCGDINTAHHEIDLARPKENEKTSGFLRIERDWLDLLVKHGYHDTFRMFIEEGGHYSWWDVKTAARERNIGWRIDHFWVSDELKDRVKDAWIACDVYGSDHCPVGLKIAV